MKNKINGIIKTFLISIILVVTVVTAIISSLSILKEEAIKTHIEIAKLHANTLSEQVTQTFNNINLLTSNIISIIDTNEEIDRLDNKFKEILFNSPYIRSISILNSDKKIIYSSNSSNVDLEVDVNTYYPKPLFDNSILRFGLPWMGRDLANKKEIINKNSLNYYSSFIPVAKYFKILDKDFYILVTVNSDYFINRYADNLKSEYEFIDLIRVDGLVLFSSDKNTYPRTILQKTKLYEESLNSSLSWGIEEYKNKKYITSYHLSDLYPLSVVIRIDLKSSLKDWEAKSSNISLLVTSLLIISALLVIILILKYQSEKENELKAHRKQLKQQKKFQLLFEHGLFLVAILKADGRIIDMNHVGQNLLNKSVKELIGKKFWDITCWEEKDKRTIESQIVSYSKDSVFHEEFIIKDSKNQAIDIEFSLMSIEMDGEFELVALGLDITQRKHKEKQLKQAYTVFQNTHDGIMITDERTNIINVNNAFTKSTGYSLKSIYKKSPKVLQSGKHSKEFYESMWRSISKLGLWEGELINKKKNGEYFNEYITISAVYDEKGEVKNYIGIFSDTTKQKEQEKRLKEQEKILSQQSKMAAMGEMIENIAHQWRQPLSVISSISTGMIFKKNIDIEDKEEEIKELDKINDTTQYLSQTIDDFRNFLRTDKPKMHFNLEGTLNNSLKLISSKLKNKNIEIVKNINDVVLLGIENELIQVFLNIFNNSRDILDTKDFENKVILIDVKKENNNAIIQIKDNGGGVDEEIIDRLFEPYFTTKHKSQGTGIGLYMTEEIIVKHMNGTISCYNEAFEYKTEIFKGACFEIVLPINED